jgi:hypothetical protein
MQALRVLLLLCIAAIGGLCAARAETPPPPAQSAPQADNTTATCLWGFLSSLREVGRRCDGAQFNTGYHQRSEALQAEIDESSRRLERYLVQHDPSAPAAIERTRQQISATSTEEMCSSEIGRGYPSLVMQRGTGWVRSLTDQVLSGANHDGCF